MRCGRRPTMTSKTAWRVGDLQFPTTSSITTRRSAYRQTASRQCVAEGAPVSFERLASQPTAPTCIESFDGSPFESWHVGLQLITYGGLQVRQVSVALGKLLQERLIERERCARIHWVDSVLLINGLA